MQGLVHPFFGTFSFQKVERVRRSYRQQLVNAIQKIAGEYKVLYTVDIMYTQPHKLPLKQLDCL